MVAADARQKSPQKVAVDLPEHDAIAADHSIPSSELEISGIRCKYNRHPIGRFINIDLRHKLQNSFGVFRLCHS